MMNMKPIDISKTDTLNQVKSFHNLLNKNQSNQHLQPQPRATYQHRPNRGLNPTFVPKHIHVCALVRIKRETFFIRNESINLIWPHADHDRVSLPPNYL